MEGVRACGMKGRERQDDVTHYQFDGHAIEQSADQRMLNQETQLAAGAVVDGGNRSGDEEVQQDAENIGTGASVESLLAQQPAGKAVDEQTKLALKLIDYDPENVVKIAPVRGNFGQRMRTLGGVI